MEIKTSDSVKIILRLDIRGLHKTFAIDVCTRPIAALGTVYELVVF